MEIAKERNVYADNVKGILIFLVVFGHVIEPYIYQSNWYIPYAYIYIFHMPLFIYISGYFSKDAEKTQRQAFFRSLLPFVILNSLYNILETIYTKKITFSFLYDSWMLWYFLSLFGMCIMLPIIIRIRYNVIATFCFSLVIGFFNEFGGFLSLSRTICFLGYFLLGYYSNVNIFKKIKEKKIIITISVIIISVLLYRAFRSEYGVSHVKGIILSLRRSTAYKNMEMPRINGFIFRIMTIPISIVLGMLVLAYSPEKKNILTGIGKRSIIIYVFHGYLIMIYRKIIIIDGTSFYGIIILILVSIGITLFLSIPLFYKLYNWIIKWIEKIIIKK